MGKKLTGVVILALLAVLVGGLPALGGCGKQETTGLKQVIIGVMGDFTGYTAFGVSQSANGAMDYVRDVQASSNPIPGITIKFATSDHGGNYARIAQNYIWLKDQGMIFMYGVGTSEAWNVKDRLIADKIPAIHGQAGSLAMIQTDWLFYEELPADGEAEAHVQKFMDGWDTSKGKAKIGVIGMAGVDWSTTQAAKVEAFCTSHSDKLQFVGSEMPPRAATVFAGEILRLKDCDLIYIAIAGTGTPAFIKESRDRGYKGKLSAGSSSVLGFWGLVKSAAPASYRDGVLTNGLTPWWTDEPASSYVTMVKALLQKTRPGDYDAYLDGSGYLTGVGIGMMMEDVLRRAVAKVGAENLDGSVIRDALAELDMTVAPWPQAWKATPEFSCYWRNVRLMEYQAAVDKLVAITDWFTPASYS